MRICIAVSQVPSPTSHVPSLCPIRWHYWNETVPGSVALWIFRSLDLLSFGSSDPRILGGFSICCEVMELQSWRGSSPPPLLVAVAHNFMGAASANTLAKFMHIPADPPLPITLPSRSIVNLHTERRNFATYLLANLSYPFSDENVGKIWWADYAANRCEDCYAAASINN